MSEDGQRDRDERFGLYDPANERESCGVGLVAHIKGGRSHQILLDGDQALRNMSHRGGCGCEPNTGDGAGILTALPHDFLAREAKRELSVDLPSRGRYAAGLVFLPTNEKERRTCREIVARIAEEEGQGLIGWRRVPTEARRANIGPSALESEPSVEQLFLEAAPGLDEAEFERKLFLIRKRASSSIRGDSGLRQAKMFYICSLSTRVIVYKGMLTPAQLFPYYPDLSDPAYTSHLALVHSRFSTNTFPSWDRAQPLRLMCHNGEINTIRGNMNWMRARQGSLQSGEFGERLRLAFPILEPDCSDSGTFDNMLEFLQVTGRSLPEAILMMIPEAWQKHATMPPEKRAFYEFHSCLLEPWDGPASIAFSDGRYAGAVLDRNGLRPSRYCVTLDDRLIMASEAGVLPIEPALIKEKGRLEPGKILLVDFLEGRMIPDQEIKARVAGRNPYGEWLKRRRVTLPASPPGEDATARLEPHALLQAMGAFGYTEETLQFVLLPLVEEQRDPLGSMGNDSALACLSDLPRLPYDYFKQLFAQVTNPAIDSIREEIILSLECYIGPEGNLLTTGEDQCQRLLLPCPILSNQELGAIRDLRWGGAPSRVIDITLPRDSGGQGLVEALERVCREAGEAIDNGSPLTILSDRGVGADRVPISALLATGAVHHHLIRQGKRTQVGLVVETGEAREIHHHCLLFGYGADAINPYLAFEALWRARRDGLLRSEKCQTDDALVAVYQKVAAKGILKVMSKMGISTLQSYKGAQVFEAVGLASDVIERCFTGTASRIQGIGFETLAAEAALRHEAGFGRSTRTMALTNPGEFHWRAGGEQHLWDPPAIATLQRAAGHNDRAAYWSFAERVNRQARSQGTLRGLLRFKTNGTARSLSLDEVEPASDIVRRFCTGAMSFGSISAEAHETLAVAMNRIGGKSNTGEGGEDPERFFPLPNGDSKRSAIKQVASGRFGVTIWYLTNADELQIKIAQGAKPGEGGELPGRKVDQNIARIRYSTPGVGLISPPPHHDIYSIEDLKQLIHDLKNANPKARVSVKLVSEVGVGTIAAGVVKAHADHILISGDGGGTGASPLTSIKHAGLPWELGVAETHQTLVLNDLRSRVVLQTDGGLRTGRDVVVAALLGAEEFGFSTAPLITLGCIMMRKCHLNTCPVGIATQDEDLRRRFAGKPESVVNYLFMVAEEVRQILAELGCNRLVDLVGRVDLLETTDVTAHWKARGLDLAPLLTAARGPRPGTGVSFSIPQNHGLELALDNQLIDQAAPSLNFGEKSLIETAIRNTHRTVGTMLSHEVVKRWGAQGLPDDTIRIRLAGSAGQSFGAFLARGITLELEGEANDYVGKGLSGGRILLSPPQDRGFLAEESIILGNVALYGATSGQAFFRGRSAERFCVRNSGAVAVVEGVGDHGCEYMTGGRVVILGPVGRNFGAGMSGGFAYIWDLRGDFHQQCNLDLLELENIGGESDRFELLNLLKLHRDLTGSDVAARLLRRWPSCLAEFVKVVPVEYRRALARSPRPRSPLGGFLPGPHMSPWTAATCGWRPGIEGEF